MMPLEKITKIANFCKMSLQSPKNVVLVIMNMVEHRYLSVYIKSISVCVCLFLGSTLMKREQRSTR